MLPRALLVDPNAIRRDLLRREIGDAVDVTACADFQTAREHLLKSPPEFLISRIRLGPYNGLHLAYLASSARAETRCLLYDEPIDPHLAFEAQLIGAFCETTSRLPYAVRAFIRAPLPERDRRDARAVDRRVLFRGGRRSTDGQPGAPRGLGSTWLH